MKLPLSILILFAIGGCNSEKNKKYDLASAYYDSASYHFKNGECMLRCHKIDSFNIEGWTANRFKDSGDFYFHAALEMDFPTEKHAEPKPEPLNCNCK